MRPIGNSSLTTLRSGTGQGVRLFPERTRSFCAGEWTSVAAIKGHPQGYNRMAETSENLHQRATMKVVDESVFGFYKVKGYRPHRYCDSVLTILFGQKVLSRSEEAPLTVSQYFLAR